jgi:hypothetical protein
MNTVRRRTLSSFGALASVVLGSLLFASVASAQSGGDRDRSRHAFALHYGDGMRHYAEGHYDEAVRELFRAHALEPSARIARLIVRSYDAMGHCDAAARQRELLRERFRGADVPGPGRCAESGELTIECGDDTAVGEVVVDSRIETSCGSTLTVPLGTHTVTSPGARGAQRVEVTADARQVSVALRAPEAASVSSPELKKLTLDSPRSERARRPHTDVPRLEAGASQFRVIRLPGGIYYLWVAPDEGSELKGVESGDSSYIVPGTRTPTIVIPRVHSGGSGAE